MKSVVDYCWILWICIGLFLLWFSDVPMMEMEYGTKFFICHGCEIPNTPNAVAICTAQRPILEIVCTYDMIPDKFES